MIKKILPALFFVALLVLGVLYYLKLKVPNAVENNSWQSYVPENVAAVVEINTIKFRDLMISEGFKSPKKLKSLYDDLDSLKSKIKIPTKEVEYLVKEGLLLPNQFAAFEIVDQRKSIICSVFPIKKNNNFRTLLPERKYKAISKNLLYLDDKKFGLLLDGSNCLLFYGSELTEEILKQVSETIIQHQRTFNSDQMETDNPEFSLKINKGSMLHPEGSPLRNFPIEVVGSHTSGASIIDFSINNNESRPPLLSSLESTFSEESDKAAIAHVAFNLNTTVYPLDQLLGERQIRDINKSLKVIQGGIHDLDSIWDGEISFILKKPMVKHEKFTTYSYNDNFEKVEQVRTKVDTMPVFEVLLKLKEHGNEKLIKKSWVRDNEFIAYPLQKVYYRSHSGLAHFSPTQANNQTKFNDQFSNDTSNNPSLKIFLDMKRLTSTYPDIFEENEQAVYSNHVSTLSVNEVGDMTYQLQLSYTNKTQHGLISLLEFFNDLQKMDNKKNEVELSHDLP